MRENIDDIVAMIEKMMYGHNYQTTIGYRLLQSRSMNEATQELQKIFTGVDIADTRDSNAEELWEDVNYGFNYRGDGGAGLTLDHKAEEKLNELTNAYKRHIGKHIDGDSIICRLVSYDGIPGYPVFWDYGYLIVNKASNGLFIYGSASD